MEKKKKPLMGYLPRALTTDVLGESCGTCLFAGLTPTMLNENWCPRLCSSFFFSKGRLATRKSMSIPPSVPQLQKARRRCRKTRPVCCRGCSLSLVIPTRYNKSAKGGRLSGRFQVAVCSLYYQPNKTPCLGLSNCYQCDCF